MSRAHAHKPRRPRIRLSVDELLQGFSVHRRPRLHPWNTYINGAKRGEATATQAIWGLQVIAEYKRRVRLGLPPGPYQAPPSGLNRVRVFGGRR